MINLYNKESQTLVILDKDYTLYINGPRCKKLLMKKLGLDSINTVGDFKSLLLENIDKIPTRYRNVNIYKLEKYNNEQQKILV